MLEDSLADMSLPLSLHHSFTWKHLHECSHPKPMEGFHIEMTNNAVGAHYACSVFIDKVVFSAP